jgi:uncharacterized protein (TIGR02145 family)
MKKLLLALTGILLFTTCKKGNTDPNTIVIPSVTIGTQVWMLKNLDVITYRNGDPIPKVTDPTTWSILTTGAYCYYNNDSITYAATYGKLYNWYAVHDSRGIAPVGWHISSDAEWVTLKTYLGGQSVAGGPLKETSTLHWLSPNTGATNNSGFKGLPGGLRNYDGPFNSIGKVGYWWSSIDFTTMDALFHYLSFDNVYLNGYHLDKRNGFSVRCFKD